MINIGLNPNQFCTHLTQITLIFLKHTYRSRCYLLFLKYVRKSNKNTSNSHQSKKLMTICRTLLVDRIFTCKNTHCYSAERLVDHIINPCSPFLFAHCDVLRPNASLIVWISLLTVMILDIVWIRKFAIWFLPINFISSSLNSVLFCHSSCFCLIFWSYDP